MNSHLWAICSKVLDVPADSLGPESNASNVESWDSLAHWDIVAEVEQHFGIEFSIDEANQFRCLADIDAAISTRMK